MAFDSGSTKHTASPRALKMKLVRLPPEVGFHSQFVPNPGAPPSGISTCIFSGHGALPGKSRTSDKKVSIFSKWSKTRLSEITWKFVNRGYPTEVARHQLRTYDCESGVHQRRENSRTIPSQCQFQCRSRKAHVACRSTRPIRHLTRA